MRATSAEIEAIAADWAVKADHAPLDADARRSLDDWLAADIRHRGAFARAQGMLIQARRAKALGSDFDPDVYAATHVEGRFEEDVGPAPANQEAEGRRSFLKWFGTAAAGAALLFVSFGLVPGDGSEAYATARGEVRLIPMPDGSRVTLNTASSAKIIFTDGERRVDLGQGEALFDVTKDPARPFVVWAGDTRIRAVGTSFTVRRLEGGKVQVLVREGVVEVSGPASPRPARATANSRMVVDGSYRVEAINSGTLRRELAWREGMLAFEDQRLDEAAKEFARYSDVAIRFADPAIAEETVTGLYAANDPQGFARSAALSLGLRAERNADGVLLKR